MERLRSPVREMLMAKALEIRPTLMKFAAESQQLRTLSDSTVGAIRDAGLFAARNRSSSAQRQFFPG